LLIFVVGSVTRLVLAVCTRLDRNGFSRSPLKYSTRFYFEYLSRGR
jgi:hypothetical protein